MSANNCVEALNQPGTDDAAEPPGTDDAAEPPGTDDADVAELPGTDDDDEPPENVPRVECHESGLTIWYNGFQYDSDDENIPTELHQSWQESKRMMREESADQCRMAGCIVHHSRNCPFPNKMHFDTTKETPSRHPYKREEWPYSPDEESSDDDLSVEASGPSSSNDGCKYRGPEALIQWKQVAASDRGYSQRPDTIHFLSDNPWDYDRFRELFSRLIILENSARSIDETIDNDVVTFVRTKEAYFLAIGGTLFNGTRFDETPNYSDEESHPVKFGTYGLQDLGRIGWLSHRGHNQFLFEELFRRTEYLSVFHRVASSDLDRLRTKEHDGKSARHYRKGDKSPLLPLKADMPWYLQNDNISYSLNESWRRNNGECLFCVVDRRLHRLEFELERLSKYVRRWPNCGVPPRGSEKAKKQRWTMMKEMEKRNKPLTMVGETLAKKRRTLPGSPQY